jgi:sec-independent protein translocase protein TatC
MRRVFGGLRKFITAPARWGKSISHFMNAPLEERSLGDAVADVAQDPSALIPQVEALRTHLLRMLLWTGIAVGVALVFSEVLLSLLAGPIGGIDELRAIEVTENLGVFMRIGLAAGIALALPLIAFEVWLFVAPGLSPRARWMGLLGIPAAVILFYAGAAFAYFVMLPVALPFLTNFMGIPSELRPASYYGFVTNVMFWLGLSFQFPLVIFVLSSIGFVKPRALLRQWRLALVIIAVVAAAVTPTVDPVNMSIVMVPLVVLYFVSILLSYLAVALRREQPSPEGET